MHSPLPQSPDSGQVQLSRLADVHTCDCVIYLAIITLTRCDSSFLVSNLKLHNFFNQQTTTSLKGSNPVPLRFPLPALNQALPQPSTQTSSKMPVIVSPYDPAWPAHFTRIATQLASYLSSASVPYITIEHVGSTAVPNLAAKPNIDIVILVKDTTTAEAAREALIWEPEPTEYYICIGHGGIKGRISMKFHNWQLVPYRSVYIISEDDEDGMLGLKGYRDLMRVLTADGEKASELRKEYEDVKWELMRGGWEFDRVRSEEDCNRPQDFEGGWVE